MMLPKAKQHALEWQAARRGVDHDKRKAAPAAMNENSRGLLQSRPSFAEPRRAGV